MHPDETLWTAVFYAVFITGVFISLIGRRGRIDKTPRAAA
jgi:hypothetical protein